MPLKYAEDLEHIYGAFNNHPIAKEDLDAFYQEASAVQGNNPKAGWRACLGTTRIATSTSSLRYTLLHDRNLLA